MTELNREYVWDSIVACLRELMEEQEQEIGEVTPDTYFGEDLGVSSIDLIHLMVALEDRLQRPLSFDELSTLPDGQYRKDLTAGELLDFAASRVLPARSAGTGD